MDGTDQVTQARASFGRRAWRDAHDALTAADASEPLGAADLERLAVVEHLLGRDDESESAWARAHRAHLDRDEASGAARCAFWRALGLVLRGEMARAGGWFARAHRLLDESQQDCVEAGYLWDSVEDASRFLKDRLGPALQAAGASGRPPEPQLWPVHAYMK